MTAMALPAPTTDVDLARRDLDHHGYCVVADAVDPATLAALCSRLSAVAADEVAQGHAYFDSGGANQRVWQLVNKGEEFRSLATHPVALAFMDHLIGDSHAYGEASDGLPNFLLSSLTANIAGPGGVSQPLHADQGYIGFPCARERLVANVAWMLDDFTAANGATRVVPGSQRLGHYPDAEAEARAVPVEGPAGSALVFDGRLWHGTGSNTTTAEERHAVLAYYCRPWIRQQENSTVSVDPAVLANASAALRRLLGFDLFHTLGMIGGLPPRAADRHRRSGTVR